MNYENLTDAELRRLIAASPETNEAAHLEAVRRFVEQDEMYTQDELDEAEDEARNVGYDNGFADALREAEEE